MMTCFSPAEARPYPGAALQCLHDPHTSERSSMRIEVRGRNTDVTDELRGHVEKRFSRIGQQVSELAVLEVELSEERNPSIADSQVAEATLHLKRATLRAREATPEMLHSIHEIAEDLRRQVKRHRDKRRKRSQTRRLIARVRGRPA